MTTLTIRDFFSKKFEDESTNILLDNAPYFSEDAVIDYVMQIQKYALKEYISYLAEHPILDAILSKDITQLSSIEDCTNNICRVLRDKQNPGMSLIEIATALHADNSYKDNTVALTKYGENQVKTAAQLGLAVYRKELWYLSAIGYVFPCVEDELQRKYLALAQLRDPFYSKVILSLMKRDTDLKDYMTILSESTQKRRTSSCLRVLSYFFEQCSIEGVALHNIIR